jgi:hypothetical protein
MCPLETGLQHEMRRKTLRSKGGAYHIRLDMARRNHTEDPWDPEPLHPQGGPKAMPET